MGTVEFSMTSYLKKWLRSFDVNCYLRGDTKKMGSSFLGLWEKSAQFRDFFRHWVVLSVRHYNYPDYGKSGLAHLFKWIEKIDTTIGFRMCMIAHSGKIKIDSYKPTDLL